MLFATLIFSVGDNHAHWSNINNKILVALSFLFISFSHSFERQILLRPGCQVDVGSCQTRLPTSC